MISRVSFLFIVTFLFILMSCDSNRLYETNHDFEDRTWKVNDAPDFEFRISDTGKKYNVYYNVRNSLDYPYSRIFVTYHLQDSIGKELQSKLDTQDLFDQKTGAPLGASGLGDLYDHRFALLSNYEFKIPGRYKIKLEQFTRQDTLRGILAVGVRIEEAPEK